MLSQDVIHKKKNGKRWWWKQGIGESVELQDLIDPSTSPVVFVVALGFCVVTRESITCKSVLWSGEGHVNRLSFAKRVVVVIGIEGSASSPGGSVLGWINLWSHYQNPWPPTRTQIYSSELEYHCHWDRNAICSLDTGLASVLHLHGSAPMCLVNASQLTTMRMCEMCWRWGHLYPHPSIIRSIQTPLLSQPHNQSNEWLRPVKTR